MKIVTLFLTFIVGLSLYAQFPAPTDFDYDLCYNQMGELRCAPDLPELSYRTTFTWVTPDIIGISSTLTGYKIYWNGSLLASPSTSPFVIDGGFSGSLYITAVYSNPSSESVASNVINVDLPLDINALKMNNIFELFPNPATETIYITGSNLIKFLNVYNSAGKKIDKVISTNNSIDIKDLSSGLYFFEIVDVNNQIYSKTIIKK